MQAQAASNWPVYTPRDPYFYANSLLLNGDGTNGAQNNTFPDSSTNNITLNRNGNLTQGSFNPYGSNWSNYFNGSSGNYIYAVGANTACAMGTGNWTVEAWVYLTTGGGTPFVFDTLPSGSGATTGLRMRLNSSNQVQLWQYASAVLTSSVAVALNGWTHVALVKNSGTTTVYINGIASGTYSDSGNYICAANRPMIGSDGYDSGNSSNFPGYISNIRFVKGTAVYTSNFTPSTTPLTAISGTSLLTCQSNRFKDSSSNNFTITANGTPQVLPLSPFNPTSAYSTTTNGGSAYFSASSYLNFTSSAAQVGGNTNFTFETWFYPIAGGPYGGGGSLIDIGGTNNGYFGLAVGMNCAYGLGVAMSPGFGWPFNQTFTGALPINQWYHVAITRSSGNIVAYLNGVSVGTGYYDNSKTGSENYIGFYTNFSSNYDSCYGYMAGYRLVVGSVVYTSNFTPPTAPPANITNTALLPQYTNAGIPDLAMQSDLQTVGNAQVNTSVKKYGTGSIAFDGSGDYLLTSPAATFNPGVGSWTIEGWVNFTTNAFTQVLVSGNPRQFYFVWANEGGGKMIVGDGAINNINQVVTIPAAGTWWHMCLVKDGATYTVYVNGTAVASSTTALASNNIPSLFVGSDNGSSGFYGYIDELRITNGVARYTANFTPPTAAFPTS